MTSQLKIHTFDKIDTDQMGSGGVANAYLYRRLLVVLEPDSPNVHVTDRYGNQWVIDMACGTHGEPSAASFEELRTRLDEIVMSPRDHNSFDSAHANLRALLVSDEPMILQKS